MKRKKTTDIIPAILEKKFINIQKKIKKVEKIVNLVQIDICDGNFVKSKTFGSSGNKKSFLKLQKITKNLKLEIDLMVNLDFKNRDKIFFNSLSILKPERIIFHIDSTKNWNKIFDFIKKTENKKIKIALGIKIQNTQKQIDSILKKYNFDYVQFMGIEEIGFGGQKISNKIFLKIKEFCKKYPEMYIQVDGGVKIENAEKLKKSGVCSFVSGSGVYKSENIIQRIKEFKRI